MIESIWHLEEWWLSSGFKHLTDLVNVDSLGLGPGQVGFVEAIQKKLNAFDNDDLHRQLYKDESSPVPPPAIPSSREKLGSIKGIFERTKDGRLDHIQTFEVLAMLEQVEIHRKRLAASAKQVIDGGLLKDHNSLLIKKHGSASERYSSLQLYFRAHVSIPPHLACCNKPLLLTNASF